MHFRAMFDSDFVGVWDLDGRDRTVTIARVEAGTVGGQNGRKKDRKAIIHLREIDKPIACNVTNARTIAGLYGSDVSKWAGKKITLYPTTTTFGRETVECIRVRPVVPSGPSERLEPAPVDREVRSQQERAARAATHPAAPLGAAKTSDELLAAIGECAAWITANHEDRWPKVLERCRELGVSEDAAVEAVAKATPRSGA